MDGGREGGRAASGWRAAPRTPSRSPPPWRAREGKRARPPPPETKNHKLPLLKKTVLKITSAFANKRAGNSGVPKCTFAKNLGF